MKRRKSTNKRPLLLRQSADPAKPHRETTDPRPQSQTGQAYIAQPAHRAWYYTGTALSLSLSIQQPQKLASRTHAFHRKAITAPAPRTAGGAKLQTDSQISQGSKSIVIYSMGSIRRRNVTS
uniref:Uncharacterized protein n=1 Tax=Oryza brachyantha TaxID=4533 RepID=J3LZK8_ORYBR